MISSGVSLTSVPVSRQIVVFSHDINIKTIEQLLLSCRWRGLGRWCSATVPSPPPPAPSAGTGSRLTPSGHIIGKNDPQKKKKVEKFHVLKCYMFSFGG
jgi:hypothetical protein